MDLTVYERGTGDSSTSHHHLSDVNSFLPPQEPLIWLVSPDISCDIQIARATSQIAHQIDASGAEFGAGPGFGNPCAQLNVLDLDKQAFEPNQAHSSSINSHRHIEGHNIFLAPSTAEEEESSDGGEGNHFNHGSDSLVFGYENQRGASHIQPKRVEMISMLSQRRTEALVESCIAEYERHATTLQVLNDQLNQRLVEIISMAFSSYLKANKDPIRMYGGFWWVAWHILKAKIIVPRLISRGVINADTEFDETLDVLRNNTPHWLRPTEVQRSVL
jgi:hypothetical protein